MVKEDLRAAAYARYTDDFLLWSDDKGFLQHCHARIAMQLADDRLSLHPVKTCVMSTSEGVPFLGFRFLPGRQPRLLGETKRRFEKRSRRQVAAIGAEDLVEVEAVRRSMRSWASFAVYGNVKGLFKTYRHHGFGQPGP